MKKRLKKFLGILELEHKTSNSFQRLKEDIDKRFNKIHCKVEKINNLNLEERLKQLETKPTKSTKQPDQDRLIDRPSLDLDSFTEQEKNILNVFANKREMSLSYKDIATELNKSPNTIKNQVNMILKKSNIFKSIIENNKKRFKLRQTLQIKKTV